MQSLFKKYFNQSMELPLEIRQQIPEAIYLYSFWDLDEQKKLINGWVVLTQSHFYVFKQSYLVKKVELSVIKKLNELNFNTLLAMELIDDENQSLVFLTYTNKQKKGFAQIQYALSEIIKGNQLKLGAKSSEIYQESVLSNITHEQNMTSENKNNIVLRLIHYIAPYKKQFYMGIVAAVCLAILSLGPAYISGYLIDHIIKKYQDQSLSHSDAIQSSWYLILMLFGFYGLKQVCVWLRLKNMSLVGERVASDLRNALYTHLQKLGMDFYTKRQTGSIISRISNDTDRIWDFIAFGIVEVGIAIIMLVSLSAVLIYLDWKLGLLMTIPVPLFIGSIFFHGKKMEKIFLKCWRKWSNITDVLSDTIPGVQVVKAFNQEKKELDRFQDKNKKALDEFEGVHIVWTKFWPKLMLSVHAIILAVWIFALPRLLSDSSSTEFITAGTFVSFLLYMTMFIQPIEIIGQVSRMLNRATSSAFRIFELLDTKPSSEQDAGKKQVKLNGGIEFENIEFSYDGLRQVLKNISFKIQPGEMIGMVGPSGGGKSSITKLLTGFYQAQSGQIKFDGHSISKLDRGFLRKQIGVVLQDPFLFHGSIKDNIAYGLNNASEREIIQAAKIANAHEFIMKLPEAYETKVGERGQTLSGGEKQRISIARAILHDPKILVLDEATSAVDTETERNIQEALDRLIKDRTVIAIAHRLSTLRKANRIMVVKDGELIEVGQHSELMKLKGEYYKLHAMQNEMHELMHGKLNQEVTHETSMQ